MQPRAVVVNTGGLQPITAADSVSDFGKILNVGSRPSKWNGIGQFEVFKLELVLHFKAINLPKNQWGNVTVTFLELGPRSTFLARLTTELGREFSASEITDLHIDWDMFIRIMETLYAQKLTELELRDSIEQQTLVELAVLKTRFQDVSWV